MPRLQRKIDFMVGSERMLKAHHKNAVFFKSLQNQKTSYDQRCTKNLGKMQQDIYEVYFNEYLPLKAEANKTRQRLPKLQDPTSSRDQLEPIPGRGRKAILPEIASQTSLNREESCIVVDTERYLNNLREKAAARKLMERQQLKRDQSANQQADLKFREGSDVTCRNDFHMQSRCSGWPDSVSECSETPPIDEKRLQILKTAIALTSQPVKPPEPRKPRRLRRSFLINLRRQSKQVWENEVLQRVFKDHHNITEESEESEEKPAEPDIKAEHVLKWRPSLSKNKICNEDDDDDDADDMVFTFTDRRTSAMSQRSEVSRVSIKRDIPLHDIEDDLYYPESSPDLFSVISEHTGSYYSDSSYTSGSDYSYSSTQSDDNYLS